MLDLDAALPQINQKKALADYDRYLEAVSIETVTQALAAIEAAGYEADLTEAGGARAAAMAIQALREGTPFSLVRIGDGEGNILGALDPDFPAARQFSTQMILEMMFGASDFSAREVQRIAEDMATAVLSADVLGVSDHVRIGRLQILRQCPEGRQDVRGYMGSYESILQVSSLLHRTGSRPPIVVSNYVHRQMMALYGEVMRAARQVTLIGPYDLVQDIRQAFGVHRARALLIPNQASSSPGEGAKWFPKSYDDLRTTLDAQPGEVFFISAGILGKGLCNHVKARGGVALDIGSVVDVWIGKAVRNYHSADFLARHRVAAPVSQ